MYERTSLACFIEEIKLKLPWGCIAGKTWGMKNGDPVLIVHGTMDNAGSFDRIIPLLPNKFYYVAIDLPGHGLSSPLPQGIELDYLNYVLSIRLILDELKWKSCIYIGHSFGSQLGVFTSIFYPGRISKIACLDGFLPAPMSGQEIPANVKFLHDTAIQATNRFTPPLYTKEEILYALKNKRQFPLNAPAAEALFLRGTTKVGHRYKLNRDYRLRTYLSPFFSLSHYKQLLKKLNIPVYIIVAQHSWFTSAMDESTIESLKNMLGYNYRIVVVKGNHDVHNNNPEVVAPHLFEFLTSPIIKSKL